MNPEEALEIVNSISQNSGEQLSEIEYELLTSATDVLKEVRRDSLKTAINQGNIQELYPIWSQLKNMDVTSHADVGEAQQILKTHGYYQDEIDSLYGGNTKEARLQMEADILDHPKFLVNVIMEQAKGLFQTWD